MSINLNSSEDLETMILVPHRIHSGVDHWVSVAIITKFIKNYPSLEPLYLAIIQTLK